MHRRHVVDARHDLDALVERAERDRIGALVDEVRAAHGEESAVGVERQLGVARQIARLVVADEGFLSLAGPFDRPAEPLRRPHQRELDIERAARAKIAPISCITMRACSSGTPNTIPGRGAG